MAGRRMLLCALFGAATLTACSSATTPPPLGNSVPAGSAITSTAPPSTVSAGSSSSAASSSRGSSSSQGSSSSRGSSAAAITPAAADLVTGLKTPWGIGFLPDGSALVTDRDDGTITAVLKDGPARPAGTVPGVVAVGEAGLLGLAVSPRYATDHTVFVYFTTADDNRVAAVTMTGGSAKSSVGTVRPILTGLPKAANHDGGQLAFGPDGLLYVGVGDAGSPDGAQDLGYLGGKILRLNPDGSGAHGNPFPKAPLVYSYGHRNVQGLAFDFSGRLWASEFGQNTWDELNLIKAGGNYGWPNSEGMTNDPRYVAPQRVWSTADASPSGIAIWRGSIWMASLRGQTLWQIPLLPTGSAGGALTGTPIAHFKGQFGRLRGVHAAADGSLWLTTSNTDGRGTVHPGDDRILRVTDS